MRTSPIHRFEQNGRRFAIDPETCFCFECDEISWDVLAYYPFTPVNRIYHELGDRYSVRELSEVIGELEWLRATKSIVPILRAEDLKKIFEVETGLKRLTVRLPRATERAVPARRGWFGGQGATLHSNDARQLAHDAVGLLLGRCEQQRDLHLEFLEPGDLSNVEPLADLCAHAQRAARLAGRALTVAVHVADVPVAKAPKALEGHTVSVKLEFHNAADTAEPLRGLAKALADPTLARLSRALQPGTGVTGRIVVRPGHPDFGNVVEELDKAGFSVIELDVDGAYTAHPELEPSAMLAGLSRSAVYYAQQLLKNHYFRLDPIAKLFWHIYDGSPLRRADPLGTYELAIDADGSVYPSWRLLGVESERLGSIHDGRLDEAKIDQYDDYGVIACGPCRRCWARHLCGGGTAAVHLALSGSLRRPHEPWCEAQRAWIASAVSAFNILSSEGVNFSRIYGSLNTKSTKPSLFTMVRAALGLTVAMRPIEESDAEMLVRWENWDESAYFLYNESGLLLATRYDREMDSLHPSGLEFEMVLIRKTGQPIGLLRLRPERVPGAARGAIYLRKPENYASDEIRKGFRFLLKQAGGQQAIRKLVVPAAAYETALQDFLKAVGFRHAGTEREGIFLHGRYHDVEHYEIALESL